MKIFVFTFLLLCKIEAKSPGKAVLLSALIPGGGQFYTEHYMRGTIYALTETYFIIRTFMDYREMKSAMDSYRESGDEGDYARYKDSFRKLMDDGFWFLGIWGLSLIDAYVSAHLFKFKESNRRAFTLKFKGRGVTFSFSLRF
jgi:hypothetical protein